ncbi:MAG: hypothetical protein R6W82_05145 [bacterium]
MNRPRPFLNVLAALTAAAVVVAASPPEAGAQYFSRPYAAAYLGLNKSDFGYLGSKELDWRTSPAGEVGFEAYGMTISLGMLDSGLAEWTSPDGNIDYEMQFRAVYLNLGAREDAGLYFAGGLNLPIWDVLPPSPDPSNPNPLDLDPEVGFQAFLGFQFPAGGLPLRIMIEAGYAQFNGIVTNVEGAVGELGQFSSTGPVVRAGIAILPFEF